MPQLTQYGTRASSRKPRTTFASSTSTTPNGDFGCATAIVAPRPRARCALEQAREVDVDQLVAVQREDVAASPRCELRGELDAAAAPEPLRLLGGDDLGAEPAELLLEEPSLPGGAREDHARHAGAHEPRDLVGGERPARDVDERLRAARRAASPSRSALPPARMIASIGT